MMRTQFYPPRLVADFVPRPALSARLDAVCDHLLAVVAAPGGYGKTTCVAAWLQERRAANAEAGTATAWLRIEALDNSLHRFALQLCHAIRVVHPDACAQMLAALHGSQLLSPEQLALLWVHDLSLLPGHLLLVLDDYHVLTEPAVHTFWKHVLHAGCTELTLLILTRCALPFSIARLRSQNLAMEVGGQELRLTRAESAQMLAKIFPPALDAAAVTLIHDCVDGWAAGIRLLALSLRDHPNLDQLLATLHSGAQRYVSEYFMDEVLSQQPADVQAFLLRTSILPVLQEGLCAAVIGQQSPAAAVLLDFIVRNNLFVIPLGGQERSYRYHDLFRLMLRERLSKTLPPAEIDAIYGDAARWYTAAGDLDLAIDCYLTGNQPAAAAAALADHLPTLQNREEWLLSEQLLERLPAELTRRTPALLLHYGWTYQFRLQPRQLQMVLAQVASLLDDPACDLPPLQRAQARAEQELLEISPLIFAGPLEECERRVKAALAQLPHSRHYARGYAHLFFARQLQRQGRIDAAVHFIEAAIDDADPHAGDYLVRLQHAYCLVLLLGGRLQKIAQAAKTLIFVAERNNLSMSAAFAHGAAAVGFYAACEDVQAIHHCRVVLNQRYAATQSMVATVAYMIIRLLSDANALESAAEIAADIQAMAAVTGNLETLALAQMVQAEIAVLSGRVHEAKGWVESVDIDKIHPDYAYTAWVWGRCLLASGTAPALDRGIEGLSTMIARCQTSHATSWVVELSVLLARLHAAQDEMALGLSIFQAALLAGYRSGYWRSFAELDPVIEQFLVQSLRQPATRAAAQAMMGLRMASSPPDGAPHAPLAKALAGDLSLSQAPDPSIQRGEPVAPAPENPLSLREEVIVLLLVDRLTIAEIAHRLSLSPNTVRNHTAHIYTKLAVHNRRELLAYVRATGLLDRYQKTAP